MRFFKISWIFQIFYTFLNSRQILEKLIRKNAPDFQNLKNTLQFLLPVLWPAKKFELKVLVVLSVISVIIGTIVNVLVPIYNKHIVDSLSDFVTSYESHQQNYKRHRPGFKWSLLLIYLALKVLQGVGSLSLLNCIQSLLWIKLENNARKEIQIHFFSHVHKLSVRWQLEQKTADILGSLERGTSGVTSILEQMIYSIIPTIVDITIAIIFLSTKFHSLIGLIVLTQVGLYIYSTVSIVQWRSKFQVLLNTSDNEQRQQAMESLLNFETVKYYVNEDYEVEKYSEAINRFNKDQFKLMGSINLLQLVQLTIVNVGLFVGSFFIISMIVDDNSLSVGDYVLFASYMGQLILPLNYLGCNFRDLKISLTDMKGMLDILKIRPEIQISSKARDLLVPGGQIEFKSVSFSYGNDKQVLDNVSFIIPARKTVALVGPSGSGKSSIIRLLTRLYDVDSGEILIDGQNVKNVTLSSLRKSMGVVPQDTILFHDTIANNIRYAKLDATDSEVILAAEGAQIQSKIQSLPKGFTTMVGERGLKLSGGEKQRIAIARMFLKNPGIILLDEATSALDANTEQEILSSFEQLCRTRTCLFVTHRLQSVMKADEILVLKNGNIIERGTHAKLLRCNGEYASMWKQQQK